MTNDVKLFLSMINRPGFSQELEEGLADLTKEELYKVAAQIHALENSATVANQDRFEDYQAKFSVGDLIIISGDMGTHKAVVRDNSRNVFGVPCYSLGILDENNKVRAHWGGMTDFSDDCTMRLIEAAKED